MVNGSLRCSTGRRRQLVGYLPCEQGNRFPRCKRNRRRTGTVSIPNNHDGTFTDVTRARRTWRGSYGMGVAVGDYDNDGRPDIFLASVTANQLSITTAMVLLPINLQRLTSRRRDERQEDVVCRRRLVRLQQRRRLDLFVVNYCVWEVNKDPYCP